MGLITVIAALIAVAVIAAIRWPDFTRDRRGPALTVSVATLLVFIAAGIAQGADAPAPWPLIGLVVGVALYIAAEYLAAKQKRSGVLEP